MATPQTRQTTEKHRIIPGGEVYFAPQNADGTYGLEEYVGLTETFEITVESETADIFSAERGQSVLDTSTPIRTTRTGRMTCAQVTYKNLERFLIATTVAFDQSNTPVTDEAITVDAQDRWVQVGINPASNQVGVKDISALSVTDPTETITYTIDVDYEASAANLLKGRFYIKPGGKIKAAVDGNWEDTTTYPVGYLAVPTTANGHFYYATTAGESDSSEPTWPTDGSTVVDSGVTWQDMGLIADNLGVIWANYTPAAKTATQVRTSSLATVKGRIRVEANNILGANDDVFAPEVTLTANGNYPVKQETPDYVRIGWNLSFAEPAVGAALVIAGQPV